MCGSFGVQSRRRMTLCGHENLSRHEQAGGRGNIVVGSLGAHTLTPHLSTITIRHVMQGQNLHLESHQARSIQGDLQV